MPCRILCNCTLTYSQRVGASAISASRLSSQTLRAYNKGVSRKRAQPATSGRRRSLNSLRHSLTIDVVCRAHVYRRGMCTSLHILWLLVSGQLLLLFRYWNRSFWLDFGDRKLIRVLRKLFNSIIIYTYYKLSTRYVYWIHI